MPRKIILDCDPGHDDAMAILLALGSPEIDLLAITTVAGNQTLDKTTLNARRICTVAGALDVAIAGGCDRPLLRPLLTAPEIHGESGLDGPSFGEPAVPLQPQHAVDLILETVKANPGEVTLVPVGPLTNIAMALRKDPTLAGNVREVVLMGGSYTRGNTTPAAEFNIFVDPEAAEIVFTSGMPITMVGLDLTHQALATPEVLRRIEGIGSPLSRVVVDMLRFYQAAYGAQQGFGSPPVHDPCAVAAVAIPHTVRCKEAHVAVETAGRWTSGMTVVDFDLGEDRLANARVATELDVKSFWDMMVDALCKLST